ncbi:MAG: RDD family protein [Chloroflexi bacterium]|nr:RDD family protein [Chloroflexota bacterium]
MPNAHDRYLVETPENIELAYDVAGIGSRFLAAIVDSALIGVAQVILLFALGLASELVAFAESVLLALGVVLGFAIVWGYYIAFELVWNGQSPGKRLIGLRVVSEGGRPITVLGSAIRNVIRLIDFLPALYGIGVVTMFIDRRARRLGDLASGTLVVRERADVTLETLVREAATPPVPDPDDEAAGLPDISGLTAYDYALLREFLDRRSDLAPPVRRRLATRLAEGLSARLGLPPGFAAEQLVERIVAAYRQQRHDR